MIEFKCAKCNSLKNEVNKKWEEIFRSKDRGIDLPISVRYTCNHCNAAICSSCKEKYIKTSKWSGWEKSLCPICQNNFAPHVIHTLNSVLDDNLELNYDKTLLKYKEPRGNIKFSDGTLVLNVYREPLFAYILFGFLIFNMSLLIIFSLLPSGNLYSFLIPIISVSLAGMLFMRITQYTNRVVKFNDYGIQIISSNKFIQYKPSFLFYKKEYQNCRINFTEFQEIEIKNRSNHIRGDIFRVQVILKGGSNLVLGEFENETFAEFFKKWICNHYNIIN